MRRAIPIVLSDEERATLTTWARSRTAPARLVTRARIVLAAADGAENQDIAAALGLARGTVRRIEEVEIATPATRDRSRSGGPARIRSAACAWAWSNVWSVQDTPMLAVPGASGGAARPINHASTRRGGRRLEWDQRWSSGGAVVDISSAPQPRRTGIAVWSPPPASIPIPRRGLPWTRETIPGMQS